MPCFEDTGERDQGQIRDRQNQGQTESSGKIQGQGEASQYQGSRGAVVGQEDCDTEGETGGQEGTRAAKSQALRFSIRR